MRSDFRMMRDIAKYTRVSADDRIKELESFTTKVNNFEETAEVKKIFFFFFYFLFIFFRFLEIGKLSYLLKHLKFKVLN